VLRTTTTPEGQPDRGRAQASLVVYLHRPEPELIG
jgi:hypothetical protein